MSRFNQLWTLSLLLSCACWNVDAAPVQVSALAATSTISTATSAVLTLPLTTLTIPATIVTTLSDSSTGMSTGHISTPHSTTSPKSNTPCPTSYTSKKTTTPPITSYTSTNPTSKTSSTSSTATGPPIPFYERNLQTIKNIYNLTIYPNQVPIIVAGAAAVPKGLFALNATGRISPVGNFTSFDDSIEYFFALPPIPQSNSNGAAFTHFWIPQFSSECPEVAASTVYLTAAVVDPTKNDTGRVVTYLKQTGFWRFNAAGEVINYDLDLIQLNDFTSQLTSSNYSNPVQQAISIAGLCQQTQERCTGANKQYNSIPECIQDITAKPFGTFDNVWSDTAVCRLIHVLLTYVRPEVHCPHLGPSGGMKCVDYPYQLRMFNDALLFGSNSKFRCSSTPLINPN